MNKIESEITIVKDNFLDKCQQIKSHSIKYAFIKFENVSDELINQKVFDVDSTNHLGSFRVLGRSTRPHSAHIQTFIVTSQTTGHS